MYRHQLVLSSCFHLSLERTQKGILPLDGRHPTRLSPCPRLTLTHSHLGFPEAKTLHLPGAHCHCEIQQCSCLRKVSLPHFLPSLGFCL